ncbi:hypothetical protein ACTXT7_011854 [Hymenolepis weldensis]
MADPKTAALALQLEHLPFSHGFQRRQLFVIHQWGTTLRSGGFIKSIVSKKHAA